MNIYSLAKFFHILGALGFFLALGLEWTVLRYLRRARSLAQVREWIPISTAAARVGIASMLLILISGGYMMAVWRDVAWITVALGTLVLLVVLSLVLTRPRMAAIRRAMTAESRSVSSSLHDLLHHPILWISIQVRLALALGIVFLMTLKPDLAGSLLAIGVASILGLASSLPVTVRGRVGEEPAE